MNTDRVLAIETSGLRKVYGDLVAVENLTLTVFQGEVFGFLGPNGAGKTTVVKMLTGLIRPTAGDAKLLGRPLGDLEARRQIGFLPEHFQFHGWLRADEFLDFHGRLYGMPSSQRSQRIPELLELLGLADRARDRLSAFSKGMLQRIGIAQALLNNPKLVFLDEPTSGLDPLGRRDVRDLIRVLKGQGMTVFLNSHLLSEVELVCDRVAIINRGKVTQQGNLQELLEGSLQVEIRVIGGEPGMVEELGRIGSIVAQADSLITIAVDHQEKIPLLADIVIRRGGRLYSLSPKRRSLEELFISSLEEER